MTRSFSLPVPYRTASLWLLALGVVGVCLTTSNGLINVYRVLDPAPTMPDGSYPYPASFWQLNQALGLLSVGLFSLGSGGFLFARGADEFQQHLRRTALQYAAVTQLVLLAGLSLSVVVRSDSSLGQAFPLICTAGLVSFWLVYGLCYGYLRYVQHRVK